MNESEEQWISASAARAMGPPGTDFPRAIIERLKVGLVKSIARLLIWNQGGQESEFRECEIPQDFWRNGTSDENWDQGDFGVFWNTTATSWMAGPDATDSSAYGVSFARMDIEAMLPEPHAVSILRTGHGVKRGRSPVADWEAVMIEIARALYCGDLQPRTQADVEKAIAEHLSHSGIAPSESTIREHARPLWRAIQSEDGK